MTETMTRTTAGTGDGCTCGHTMKPSHLARRIVNLVEREVVVQCQEPGCPGPCGGGFTWKDIPGREVLPDWYVPGVGVMGGPRMMHKLQIRLAAERAAKAKLPKELAVPEAEQKIRWCPDCVGKGSGRPGRVFVYGDEGAGRWKECRRCDGKGIDNKVLVFVKEGPCPKCNPREDPTGRCAVGAPLMKMLPMKQCEVCGTTWLEGTVKKGE